MADEVSFETGYFFGPNEIFDNQIADVYEKLVYLYLCRCANNSAAAFPSYQTIADKCSMSRRKAVNVIDSLIDKKLLSKTIRRGEEKNQSNLYKVLAASARHAPPLVHSVHHPSAQHAPSVVHDMHQGSAQRAPYKELSIKNQFIKNQLQSTTTDASLSDEEMEPKKTVNDIYTQVFGTFNMPPLFREYIKQLKDRNVSDDLIMEAMLEAGESGSGKVSQRFLTAIIDRWIEKGIFSREEAKQAREVESSEKPEGRTERIRSGSDPAASSSKGEYAKLDEQKQWQPRRTAAN